MGNSGATIHVRVVVEDEMGHVEELRFTAASATDDLVVKLRERRETEAIRTGKRDGKIFTVETLPPDPKLRQPTKRQRDAGAFDSFDRLGGRHEHRDVGLRQIQRHERKCRKATLRLLWLHATSVTFGARWRRLPCPRHDG